ncbi:MAG: SRPBCC family protein [Gemmataceae bacterium]
MAVPLRFVKESRINAPPEVVFAFHESPGALQWLIPPWEPMKVVESSGSIQAGSRVILQGKVLGILPVRWVAEHTEYDPPRSFEDRQVSGPFAMWHHRHVMLPDGTGGTLLRDEIDYRLPLGSFGRLVGGKIVRKKLQRMFDYRHEVTRRMIESGEWEAASTRLAENRR